MNTPHTSPACAALADLLVDYAEYNLSPADQARVEAHLPQCPACQREVTELRQLTADLQAEAAQEEPAPPQLREQFMAALAREKAALPGPTAAPAPVQPEGRVVPMQPAGAGLSNWWLRIAAGLALLITGFGLGRFGQPDAATVAVQAPVVQEQQRARALETGTAATTLTATERIQLVSELATESEASAAGADPLVQALINTLHFDPNTNVRLAAGQALFRLRDDPRVVPALVQSLRIQTDPNVQILLIELLVAMRERRAVPQLERLAEQREILPEVREHAQSGLSQLI